MDPLKIFHNPDDHWHLEMGGHTQRLSNEFYTPNHLPNIAHGKPSKLLSATALLSWKPLGYSGWCQQIGYLDQVEVQKLRHRPQPTWDFLAAD